MPLGPPFDEEAETREFDWMQISSGEWIKGGSSGHTQDVKSIRIDCDKDCLVIEVTQHGAACHKGYYSCFYRKLNEAGEWEITDERVFYPDEVYKK